MPEETVQHEDDQSAKRPDAVVLRALPTWALLVLGAGVPALLGLTRAFVVAHGDYYAAIEVVRRIDVVSYLSGTLVIGLSTGALAVLLSAYRVLLFRRHGPQRARTFLPDGFYYLALGASLLSGLLLTSNGYVFAIAVMVVMRFEFLTRRTRVPVNDRISRPLGVAGLLLVPLVIIVHAATAPWPTPEVISVDGATPTWVYVLVVEDTHTTVLHPNGGLDRIDNDRQIERAVCPEKQVNSRSRVWHASLAQSLLRSSRSVVPQLCTSAPRPPVFRP